MFFADKLTFDSPRKTAAGYLAGSRAARSGVYDYMGTEVGREVRPGDPWSSAAALSAIPNSKTITYFTNH